MRGLLVLGLVLLVTANTVNSGAIYRRYRELGLPAGAADAEALPAESYVAELRKDQIPVQVFEVIEPLLVVKPLENLRSVEPAIAIKEAESAPAAIITNEIIPEKSEQLEKESNSARAIEAIEAIEAEAAKEQKLPQVVAETIIDAIVQKEKQELRNIELETPAAVPALLLVEEAAKPSKKEEIPIAEILEKKLLLEALPASLPAALPAVLPAVLLEALPEALPENLTKEPVVVAIMEDKKAIMPIEANMAQIKAIKAAKPLSDNLPEALPAKEVALPAIINAQIDLKPLEEKLAPIALQPAVKALKEELLMETPKKEEKLEELIKDELIEKKKEERREEKNEVLKEELIEKKTQILKEAIEGTIKEDITEKLNEKIASEQPENLTNLEDIAPSAKQAANADPGATTARPPQPGFIQQLVQNSPLGQLLTNFNAANNQVNPEENNPAATAATFIQALQNTTSQITQSFQQGLQQQIQSLQTTLSGQQPQQAAASVDAAGASTARPQGPLQSIVTSFLGNNPQPQEAAAGASQQQPGGPLQGILNFFGGNRAPNAPATPAAPTAAASTLSSTPAAELAPAADEVESAPSEAAAATTAEEEVSPEIVRDSIEAAEDSQEEVKPDEIVVSDDDSHE